MGIIDILIIVVIVFGMYLGYRNALFKELSDFIILFIGSIVSGLISRLLFNGLYKFLPFFNFYGNVKGLKSINIIFWQLILYVLILFIIISIIKRIYVKTGIEEKIKDSMVESNIITRLLGLIVSPLLMVTLMFNIILVFLAPNFNLEILNNSKGASMIMEKMPILSSQNNKTYVNEKYIIKRINKSDNKDSNYKKVNNDIINNMVSTDLISKDKINVLNKKNKLVGKRKTVMDKIIDETDVTNPTNKN